MSRQITIYTVSGLKIIGELYEADETSERFDPAIDRTLQDFQEMYKILLANKLNFRDIDTWIIDKII